MTDRLRELSDAQIDRFDDARLLALAASARAAGEDPSPAVRHLVFRHMDSVTARVRRKLPPHLVEDVAHDALLEALTSSFGGTTAGEFHRWLHVIVQRAIADFYRGPRGRQLALDREAAARARGGGDGDGDGDPAPEEAGEEGGYGEAEVQQLVDALLAARPAAHRQAIDMLVWGGHSAAETAAATGLGEANCYQVVRRFRVDLRAALDGDTGGSP